MSQCEFTTLATGFTYTEAPRWQDGKLWISDFYTKCVYSIDLDGTVTTIAEVPNQPSGLGWLPNGTLLVVSMKDKKVMKIKEDGSLEEYADLSSIAKGYCNDMYVDDHGRCYVGNFGFDLMNGGDMDTACLIMIDIDSTLKVVADELYFPNGTVRTPDKRTLIINESFGNRVSAFAIQDDGTLGERKDWAVFGPLATGPNFGDYAQASVVAPDGACIDAEGAVWISDCLGQQAVRVKDNKIVETIDLSPFNVGTFACELGGVDGKTLFLCVAPDFEEHKRTQAREGEIWMTKVAVGAA
ncbi:MULTISPECIES: SMP-30/gluconolactonase/LRE family protein [Psychrobacter]|uniref:SMP-30/gluconolactonase/LRE family protein n=1 Tax=Psychrobacter TaxID=497 RepID=UPI000C327385|nr:MULTISPECIES: SMP-30/gluconolactonase/LRE family protein [Psychrobacter]PKG35980.1 gluconolactonase [Psychrobacter sp. Sarcosine-3u-12]